nr:uncharacterized protein C9orf57 homolog [Macaca fascicularis]
MTPQYLPEYWGKYPKCDSLVVFCNACVCVSTATGTSTLDQSVAFRCNRLHYIRNRTRTRFHPFKEVQTQENFHNTLMKKIDVGGVICRACNLAIPFHGCLLDLGTCQAKPAQYCKKVVHIKGGIEWYSVKGCTKNITECFKRTIKRRELVSTHCCRRPLCNF